MTAVVLFSITRPLSGITGSSRPVRTVAGWRLLKSVRHHSVVQSQSMSHSLSLWYLVHDRVWTEGCGRKGVDGRGCTLVDRRNHWTLMNIALCRLSQ